MLSTQVCTQPRTATGTEKLQPVNGSAPAENCSHRTAPSSVQDTSLLPSTSEPASWLHVPAAEPEVELRTLRYGDLDAVEHWQRPRARDDQWLAHDVSRTLGSMNA